MKSRHYFLPAIAAFFMVFALLAQSFTPAHAQEEPDSYVKVRLLSERSAIQPGEEIWVALEQSIYPGWHTYWQNPGDSGAPSKITWTLPDGFTMGDMNWPAPHKMPYGPLLNYGYENNAIILQKLTAPATLPEGEVTITADWETLVCEEICIPEFGTANLSLNDPANLGENNAPYFTAAQSKLPEAMSWSATYKETNGDLVVQITPDGSLFFANEDGAEFNIFPVEWGLIENTADAKVSIDGDTVTITQKRGDRDLSDAILSDIVITRTIDGGHPHAISVRASIQRNFLNTTNATPLTDAVSTTDIDDVTIWQALALALLGGMVLNLMPCVFPVLSIKTLSLIKISEKSTSLARMHGVSYTAGILVSFAVIAGALFAFKGLGAEIGWGFQLQNPFVIGLLAYLLFVIGLNLMGAFEFGNKLSNVGNSLAQGDGLKSSFFTGILATLVATPCTAPFMAAALGFALVQPAIVGMLVFMALGLGLALPYLLVSFIPAMQRILPRPGAWMDSFKQFLAFPMFASAAWLVWVLAQQTGTLGVLNVLMGMIALAFGFWLLKLKPASRFRTSFYSLLSTVAFAGAVLLVSPSVTYEKQVTSLSESATTKGEAYSAIRLQELLDGNDPVFVEMTASWCITCKVNNAVAINIAATKKLFEEHNVQYLVGDWTNQDAEITKYLRSYGRSGVPIYVYYGPRDLETGQRPEAEILPQILTPGIVKNAINGA